MTKRAEKLQLAQIYYIEYLKLMVHYQFLDKEQKKVLKQHIEQLERKQKGFSEEEYEASQKGKSAPYNPFEQREQAITKLKKKKEIEAQIKYLSESVFGDESKKRELYETKLQLSVLRSLEQLKHMEEEIRILEHMEKLRIEKANQERANGGAQEEEKREKPRGELQVLHIPVRLTELTFLERWL